jgi:hypothetical protein
MEDYRTSRRSLLARALLITAFLWISPRMLLRQVFSAHRLLHLGHNLYHNDFELDITDKNVSVSSMVCYAITLLYGGVDLPQCDEIAAGSSGNFRDYV